MYTHTKFPAKSTVERKEDSPYKLVVKLSLTLLKQALSEVQMLHPRLNPIQIQSK